jgi:hypothetical protein
VRGIASLFGSNSLCVLSEDDFRKYVDLMFKQIDASKIMYDQAKDNDILEVAYLARQKCRNKADVINIVLNEFPPPDRVWCILKFSKVAQALFSFKHGE